jgi:hypothetical protein
MLRHLPHRRHPKRLVARTGVIGSLQVPAAQYRRSIDFWRAT